MPVTASGQFETALPAALRPSGFDSAVAGEDAWIEVITKMDTVYSDLVESQTLLEQQNAALEETQRFIANVLGAMTDVLIACDLRGNIQQVNAAMVELSGETEKALVGRNLSDVLHDAHSSAAKSFLKRVGLGLVIQDSQIEIRQKDGTAAPLSANGSAIMNYRGKRVGMVIVGRPDGELRRAYRALDLAHQTLTKTQQQLVVSEKMAALGRVVAGVAHELNNPISFIFGNVHALSRYCTAMTQYLDVRHAGQENEQLAHMRKSLKIDAIVQDMGPLIEGTMEGAERVRAIVEDLRRFSSNQRELPESFDVPRLLRTAVDWVRRAERVKPDVVFDVPDQLDVTMRKGHLHQVFVNLVQNAFDVVAGSSNPRVDVNCRVENGKLIVDVSDNGAGIAAENMDRIFEPFFTTKPIGKGTGLGLYISYGMIRENGGELTAVNRGGGGATFTISIPFGETDG
ncbi:PAS domain S-box protein [Neorhizobium galegae]|uniref:histidine kinase n=1 Tax=Neorhizobium galegae TaxID=399 RepID=A0A6A1TGU9_NEOGA|nr:ATP-binding protein [Neorhizobium galegae]KAB1082995.1 PAS domain S-box protein [Neorhizobium galegae]